ncbi:MAG TPA: RdgB/HAM1 family non-canonical purine NTP pyrophosphatase [Pyrinomonadaceae bacterium]|nr:RdgB/HAM1 family non-canonical purine NTP pyrophosphatase [Pyrinomonadaceae bacterium]
MRTLLIATWNRGKLEEIKDLLNDLPFNIVDLSRYPSIEAVEESGDTFADNACLKASGYAQQAGVLTLADDSGLMVDALDGAPGVRSARYAGEGASDGERTEKLLRALADVPQSQRGARFVSVIAIAQTEGKVVNVSAGECKGKIASEVRGNGGFGYDPIFIPEGFTLTFGQLAAAEKNRISHRARALAKAAAFLRALTAASRHV